MQMLQHSRPPNLYGTRFSTNVIVNNIDIIAMELSELLQFLKLLVQYERVTN